jgi:hypothetical protein
MVCLSKNRLAIKIFLLIFPSLLIASCISFRIVKVNNGGDISAPSKMIIKGKTKLADILSIYGAPGKIVEVDGKTVIIYEKSYFRGNQLSIGVPFSDITGVSLNMTAFGNLLRYDTLLVTFDDNYTLTDIAYEKGTDNPFWMSLYKD